MLIDAHAHLTDEKFSGEVKEIIERARAAGVERIVSTGSDMESSIQSVELAKQFPEVFAVVGIHPEVEREYSSAAEEKLRELAGNDKVIAIGEIGLDYHYEGYNKERQREVFIKQLELAHSLILPVVIHSRDATGDMLEILKSNKNLLASGGIVHCFSGSVETLAEIIKLGLGISLGGVITFKNAKSAGEIIKAVPKDKFVLETDCPYLCPEPHRGERNEPKNVIYVANKIAEILNLNVEEIEKISTENAKKIFKKLK